MKIVEKMPEKLQFEFMPEKGTVGALYMLQRMKKYREKCTWALLI